MHTPSTPQTSDKLAYSVKEAAHSLGIGRSTLLGLIRDGHLRSVKCGKRRLVPAAELAAFLARSLGE